MYNLFFHLTESDLERDCLLFLLFVLHNASTLRSRTAEAILAKILLLLLSQQAYTHTQTSKQKYSLKAAYLE